MYFIPAIEYVKTVVQADGVSDTQSKLATITCILTSCYTSQGGSSLVAVEGLISMLNETNFFAQDISESYDDCNTKINCARERLTMLDFAIHVVCDVATCFLCRYHRSLFSKGLFFTVTRRADPLY